MDTFNGYPAWDGSQSSACIVGIGFDGGNVTMDGQLYAPDTIRQCGVWPHAEMYDRHTGRQLPTDGIVDYGNVPVFKKMSRSYREAKEVISDVSGTTDFLVVLGGDNSVSRFAISGLDYKPYLVLFDSHSDLWEPDGKQPNDHGTWVRDVIEEELVSGVTVVGHRCLGPTKDVWDKYVVHDIPMRKYRDNPNDALWTIKHQAGDHPVYLAIDIDVVDPAFAPATATPEPGGMTSWEILDAVRFLVGQTKVKAMDITEVLPELDPAGFPTCRLANRIVVEALMASAGV